MGPTKAIIKNNGLYEAKTGKVIKENFPTHKELEEYANHHYIALPVLDKKGNPWTLEGQPVYCLHGTKYETVNDEQVLLAPCPNCGGMGIRVDEPSIETSCVRCLSCGYEFDCKLEMMES